MIHPVFAAAQLIAPDDLYNMENLELLYEGFITLYEVQPELQELPQVLKNPALI